MNTNWKSIRLNPPSEDCNIALRNVGADSRYELAFCEAKEKRVRFSDLTYAIISNMPERVQYINLDEIK